MKPIDETDAELDVLAAIKRGDRSAARTLASAYYERVYRTVPADWAKMFFAMCAEWVVNKEMK